MINQQQRANKQTPQQNHTRQKASSREMPQHWLDLFLFICFGGFLFCFGGFFPFFRALHPWYVKKKKENFKKEMEINHIFILLYSLRRDMNLKRHYTGALFTCKRDVGTGGGFTRPSFGQLQRRMKSFISTCFAFRDKDFVRVSIFS